MLLFTSSSTTIQYLLLGHLRFDYALWFGAWTLVAVSQRYAVPCSVAVQGQSHVSLQALIAVRYARVSGRHKSVLLFVLAAVIFVSAGLTLLQNVLQLVSVSCCRS